MMLLYEGILNGFKIKRLKINQTMKCLINYFTIKIHIKSHYNYSRIFSCEDALQEILQWKALKGIKQ